MTFAPIGFMWCMGKLFAALVLWFPTADWWGIFENVVRAAIFFWLVLGAWKFSELVGLIHATS